MQMFALNNYAGLSSRQPDNTFADKLKLNAYSRGMGAMGLPGDLSSQSRFVRAAFTKLNAMSSDTEEESVSQFFHILGSVEQQRGCCEVADGKYEITIYTSCCNAAKGIYYYTTYDNHQITAVDMHKENLDGTELIRYPIRHILCSQILKFINLWFNTFITPLICVIIKTIFFINYICSVSFRKMSDFFKKIIYRHLTFLYISYLSKLCHLCKNKMFCLKL
jgi:hypothetical protein